MQAKSYAYLLLDAAPMVTSAARGGKTLKLLASAICSFLVSFELFLAAGKSVTGHRSDSQRRREAKIEANKTEMTREQDY